MDAVNHRPIPQGSLNNAEQISKSAKGALAHPKPKATNPSCGRWFSVSWSNWKMANLRDKEDIYIYHWALVSVFLYLDRYLVHVIAPSRWYKLTRISHEDANGPSQLRQENPDPHHSKTNIGEQIW